MLFKNATIYTMEQDPFVGDFKIDKFVFTQIGKDFTAGVGEDVLDMSAFIGDVYDVICSYDLDMF